MLRRWCQPSVADCLWPSAGIPAPKGSGGRQQRASSRFAATARCRLHIAGGGCRSAAGQLAVWPWGPAAILPPPVDGCVISDQQGFGLLRVQLAAFLEFGGEGRFIQGTPYRGGDAVDVASFVGRHACAGRASDRVRYSEQLGGAVRLAGQCLCAGQAGERLCHGPRVTKFPCGGETLQVQSARGRRVTALLGDEAEFGQGDRARRVRFRADPPTRLQHVAHVVFGDIELAFAAGGQTESYLGEDLPGLVALFGRQARSPFEELSSLGQVPGVQRAPAQPRQRIGGLWSPVAAFVAPSHSVACSCPHRSPSSRNIAKLCWASRCTAARSPRTIACLARVLSAAAIPHRSPIAWKPASARPTIASPADGSPKSDATKPWNHSAAARMRGSSIPPRASGAVACSPVSIAKPACQAMAVASALADPWPRARAPPSARRASLSRPRRNQYHASALTIRIAAEASLSWIAESSELRRFAVSTSRRRSQCRWSW